MPPERIKSSLAYIKSKLPDYQASGELDTESQPADSTDVFRYWSM
jgi:hypothetical protein